MKSIEVVKYYRKSLEQLFIKMNSGRCGANYVQVSNLMNELIKIRENEPK